MALLAAGVIAAIGAVGSASGITASIITNNRHTIIINQTDQPIRVMVDGEELKLDPNDSWDFKVKQFPPIRIRVWRYNRDGNTIGGNDGAKVDDHGHRDFIVKLDTEGEFKFVPAKKRNGEWGPKDRIVETDPTESNT